MLPPDVVAALDVARGLVAAGVPLFVAAPDSSERTGFKLPHGWQSTQPDPRAVELWQPGWALCAVMGHGLDLVDMDPRGGANLTALGFPAPVAYGLATTPSGGVHAFVRGLGVRSRDNVLPGVDVKAGDADGRGRGFAFIAPTVRASKVTGQLVPYRWLRPPDIAALRDARDDVSGAPLADLIARLRAGSTSTGAPTPAGFLAASPWTQDVDAVLAGGRHAGVLKLAAALRGRGGWRLDDALAYMRETVWPRIDQNAGGHEYGLDEFEKDIADVWSRYPDGNEERVAQHEAALGPTPVPATVPEGTPIPTAVGLTDAYLAERVSQQCLWGRFLWTRGLDWLAWDGKRWIPGDSTLVTETIRQYFIGLHARAAASGADVELLKRLSALLTRARIAAVTDLCRGVNGIHADAADLDSHAELLNTPGGVVNLRTGDVTSHDPNLLLTKITRGSYVPGYAHEDWDKALEALPARERVWFQTRIGQAITGYPTPDGIMPILQGGGENGKSALTTDGLLPALGGYAAPASNKLFQGRNEHSTERADLRGQRLLIAEEMTEGRALDTTALKQVQDVGEIKARYVHKDNFTFPATHSLFITTNYMPVVNETDHGTWRRLAVLRFPYTFVKPGQLLQHENDRAGDPGLKARIRRGAAGRHDAAVTWAVDGARRWFADPDESMAVTPKVTADTLAWRADADRILGFWQDRLVVDHATCVTTTDMLDEFNEWLRGNGHNGWSRELFSPRFKTHLETVRNGVQEQRPRTVTGLVKRRVPLGMPRADESRPRVYVNVRFRTDNDDAADTPPGLRGPSGPTQNGAVNGSQFVTSAPIPTTPSNSDTKSDAFAAAKPSVACENNQVVQAVQPFDKSLPCVEQFETFTEGLDHLDQASPDPITAGQAVDIATSVDQIAVSEPVSAGQTVGERDLLARLATGTPVVLDVFAGQPTSKAVAKRSDAKRADKARALEEVAGHVVPLPALVTRTGEIASLTLAQADIALGPAIDSALTVDVETTGYPVGHMDHKLRTIQLGDARLAVVFDATDPTQANYARRCLAQALKLHAHSATADIVPLAHAGLVDAETAWQRMYDTVIPAKLSDPESTGSDPALKRLADVVLSDAVSTSANEARATLFKTAGWLTDTKVTTPVERSGWAQVDSRCSTMVRYAAADVLDTAALAEQLPAPPAALVERERAVQRITARVAKDGLRIDGDQVEQLLREHTVRRAEAAALVRAHGIDNPGSNTQIGKRLTDMGVRLPMTKTGAPSVAAGVLEALNIGTAAPTPVGALVSSVLTYREHDTAIGLFLEPYQQLVRRGDGRARPTVYTLGADTGRMSCVRPNLQQVPRKGGFRACITADPGHVLISADFSGVELRVAAALSGDANLARILAESDLHWEIARQVFGPNATKEQRYTIKRGVFGRLYGGSVPTLARQCGISEDVATSMVETLDNMTPQLSAWADEIRQCVRSGRTEFTTYAGRVAHLPAAFPHKGPNYCIQGTARELLVDGLLRWQETKWGQAILFPVHDEIVGMVPEDDANEATDALVETMSGHLYGIDIVAAPSKPSFAWADSV